jgi:AcrR family transcriptional regulator
MSATTVASAGNGHRQRKKERVKEKLTETALRLFIEQGFEETKVEDIVAELDIVPRTFFRYFSSKADALLGWYDVIEEEGLAALRSRPRGEGIVTALIASHQGIAKAHRGQERIYLIMHQLTETSAELRERRAARRFSFQRKLAQALTSRLPPSAAMTAEMITGAIATAYQITVDQWTAEGTLCPLQAYAEAPMRKALKLFHEIDRRFVLR